MATASIVAPIAEPGTPLPRPIRALNRKTGLVVELVPSQSRAGLYHLVDPKAGTCDCRGYQYRQRCSHVAAICRPLADGGAAHLQVLRASGNWPTGPAAPCGIHGTVHACHCPTMKSWCADCPPLGGVR